MAAVVRADPPTLSELLASSFVENHLVEDVEPLVKLLVPPNPDDLKVQIRRQNKPAETAAAPQLSQSKFRKMVEVVVSFMESGQISNEMKDSLESDADREFSTVFRGVYAVFWSAARCHVKEAVMKSDLLSLGIPQTFVADLVSAFFTKHEALEQVMADRKSELPTIIDTKWRVDVTISTTSLSRVFKPTLLMRLALSDGRIRTFECSVEQFHQLRYNVARVFKHMQDLQQHPMLNRDLDK